MPDGTGFCHRCGAPLPPGATFCPKCGTAVASPAGVQPTSPQTPMGRRNEKGEKGEKHEKNEKQEKSAARGMLGAAVGGLIIIWLGVTYFLEQNGYLPSNIWWAYFMSGVGIVLVLEGVVIYSRGHVGIGPVIGGAILIFLGLSAITTNNFRFQTQLWPLAIVVIGVLVLLSGFAYRRRVPPP